METLLKEDQPWHQYQIRPGSVGPIVFTVPPRFRQSTASMPWAYDPYWTTKRATRLGGNLQNGTRPSYDTGGGPPRTNDSRWSGNRSADRHKLGYRFHNIAPIAKFSIPAQGPQGDYAWRDKVAVTRHISPAGRLFLPANTPAYGLQGKLRSGNYPVSTAVGGDQGPVRPGQVTTADYEGVAAPRVPGQAEDLPNRAGANTGHGPGGRGFNRNDFNRGTRF